jgi:ABC-type uncharacterized transport system substrate-binding protein
MRYSRFRRYWPILPAILIIVNVLLTVCGDRQKTHVIGVINFAPGLNDVMEGFKEGMAEAGYTENENITYMYEGGTTSIGKLDSVAQGLVTPGVDLILSVTTPATLAAKRPPPTPISRWSLSQ